jgi:DNA replication and repair protein RecF
VAAHENAVSQRNRLLATGRSDPGWLAGVEDQIARHAVSMTAGRMELVGRLARTAPAGGFPAARIDLKCPIAAHLAGASALATEDWLRATLVAARTIDAASGGTSIGAHRADMSLVDVTSGTPAQSGSTGEQKAMLIGIILSHAALISERRGSAPLLLLDEPLVHLDSARRRALFASLTETGAQAILTGTDADVFTPLSCKADVFIAGDGALRAEN